MPEKKTLERAKKARKEGKAPSTQASEFVREEMEHIRQGKHGARSTKQAIAIGLSKARRAGVPLKPPSKGKVSEQTRKSAESAFKKGQKKEPVSPKRSAAREKALKREPKEAASHEAISRQTKESAKKRGSADRTRAAKQASVAKSPAKRSIAAKKAAATKGPRKRSEAAKKAAATRKTKAAK